MPSSSARSNGLVLAASVAATFALAFLVALAGVLDGTATATMSLAATTPAEPRIATPDTSMGGWYAAESATHVWVCPTDYLGAVPQDGSLSEWAPHYFVAHSFGTYGQAILSLTAGDTVWVNGEPVRVEGSVVAAKFSPYDQIMETVGWDATVFQTCIPDTSLCLFVYARGDGSAIEEANEARTFAGLAPYADEDASETSTSVTDLFTDAVTSYVSTYTTTTYTVTTQVTSGQAGEVLPQARPEAGGMTLACR